MMYCWKCRYLTVPADNPPCRGCYTQGPEPAHFEEVLEREVRG